MKLAIACMSGSFKGIFVHGALSALEAHGLRADAYAAASSSTLSAAYAAIGEVGSVPMSIWTGTLDALARPDTGMSDVVLANIRQLSPNLLGRLFEPSAARFLIATSVVTTAEAAAITQGPGARRLGRRLLVDAARRDATWRNQHLAPRIFDTQAPDPHRRLTVRNFEEVAYASTRMMHAWHIPATIGGVPHVDASYTCLCPAAELAELGYSEVVAIATEPGPIHRDMFSADLIDAPGIRIIQPDADLHELGVDFAGATADGLQRALEHGAAKARAFLSERERPVTALGT
jgi:hypothetical protein